MSQPTRTAILQEVAFHLPPVVIDPGGGCSVAAYPGESFLGLAQRLCAAAGPLPEPARAGLPDLARRAIPAQVQAHRFEKTDTPLSALSWGRPVEKLAWHPLTGALFFVHPPQHHATALQGRRFHDHVRAILLHTERRLCIRPCTPEWVAGGPHLHLTVHQAWASTALQLAARAALLGTPGGCRWTTELNINNRRLEHRTGRRGW